MNLVNSQIGQDMLCRGEVRERLRVCWEIGLRERDESQLMAGLESQTGVVIVLGQNGILLTC